MSIFSKLLKFLIYEPNYEIRNRGFEENTRVMRTMTFVFTIVETVALAIFVVLGNGRYVKTISIINASIGLLINLGYYLLSKIIEKRPDTDKIQKVTQIIYFIALVLWSLRISFHHYVIGVQINMLYIVMIGGVFFITLPPKMSTPLIAIPFLIFYLLVYRHDGAIHMINVNYVALCMMCLLGSYTRYSLKVSEFTKMMELERINMVLGKESRQDKGTGLRNRLGLSDDYDAYKGHKICIIMIDIDYFKQYNDTYGHLIGDKVLSYIANALIETFSQKYCYRFGGDELMVIIPDQDEGYIDSKISEWLGKVDSIAIDGVEHKLTCSYGCAYGTVWKTKDFVEMQQKADDRLYEAKKNRPEWTVF